MFVDLTPLVHRGVIDNTTRDTVELHLWCGHEDTPVRLTLPGNCLRDIAGCRVSFSTQHRASAAWEEAHEHLLAPLLLEGISCAVGDITLSRRAPSQKLRGTLANFLSIEFFVDTKVRYLIECEDFTFRTTLPQWECTRACENMQEMLNMSALRDYVLYSTSHFRGPGLAHAEAEMPPCKWDAILNRAEAFMSIAPFIVEKYAGHPRSKLAEAFVMDCDRFLDHIASEEETHHATLADAEAYAWAVLDFMTTDEAHQVRRAMEHPLFDATAQLSATVQRYVLSDPERYEGNKDIETMLTRYAGIISNVLSTILLVQESPQAANMAMARIEILSRGVERLKGLCTSLRAGVRAKFIQGADHLIRELKAFFFTLRR